MGLCQAHGARPAALHQFGQIDPLLLRRAVMAQRICCTVRQAGIHAPGEVGCTDHFRQQHRQRRRQALATMLGLCGQPGPAAIDVLTIGVTKAVGGLYIAVLQTAALLVSALIQRQQHFTRKARSLVQNGRHHVWRNVVASGQAGVMSRIVEQLIHHEAHVAQRCLIIWHGSLLSIRGDARATMAHRAFKHVFENSGATDHKSSVRLNPWHPRDTECRWHDRPWHHGQPCLDHPSCRRSYWHHRHLGH